MDGRKFQVNVVLIIWGGITRLVAKTHTSSISYFGIDSVILKSDMQIGLKIGSVWVGTSMVPIEIRSHSITNITSFSFNILEWKS